MKGNSIIRIVIYSLTILVLTALLMAGLTLNLDWINFFSFGSGKGTEGSHGTVDPHSVREISVEWATGNITIQPGDVEEITFSETLYNTSNNPMIWNQNGDELTIRFWKSGAFNNIDSNDSKDLLITVPREWTCEMLQIDAAAANVNVSDLVIGDVDMDSAAGNLIFKNCSADSIDLDGAAGKLDFSGTLDSLDCDGMAFDCTLNLTDAPREINMDAASGDLTVYLPADCGFAADVETLSGHFNTDFTTTQTNGNYICGDGGCRIDATLLSGDVSIHKSEQP